MQREKKLWYIYDLLNFLYLVMVNHICDHQAISSEGQCGAAVEIPKEIHSAIQLVGLSTKSMEPVM